MRISTRRIWWYAGIAVILILLATLAIAGYLTLFQPVSLAESQTVVITPQSSFGYVATRLRQRGMIPNVLAFKVYARLTGKANKLKVGEFEIQDGMSPVDILDLLVSGRAKVYSLTIPEGKWASEIDGLVAARWPDAAAHFSELIDQPQQWNGKVAFPLPVGSLEGYLFPDTYRFPRETTAQQIVGKMLERFQITCWAAYTAHKPADGRSLHDVLVLASLVEAEAKVPAERPTIAGVYMNRLARGMLLQCDATVLYAKGERLRRVLYRDLEVDSPYNTYRYAGLPPGPICSPGLSSFKAALQPADVPYLYYVARGDGSHVFTRTVAEHNAAIQRIRGK